MAGRTKRWRLAFIWHTILANPMLFQNRYPLAATVLLIAIPASSVASHLMFQIGVDWITAVAVIMPPLICFFWIFATIRAAHLAGIFFWSIPSTYASLVGGVACFIVLIIAAGTGNDKANHEFHAGPTIIAVICYGVLLWWTVWYNAK